MIDALKQRKERFFVFCVFYKTTTRKKDVSARPLARFSVGIFH